MQPDTRAPRMEGRVLRRDALLPWIGAAMLGAVAMAGCVDDALAPHVPAPPTDATPLYWSLRNDHRAVTLSTVAPYDTLRITAVPHDAVGRPLDLEGERTYTSTEPGRVQVSSDGLIRAVAPGVNVYVISTLAAGNVRHADTTVVNVTASASPPSVAFFSTRPVAPDSARWAVHFDWQTFVPGYDKRLPLRVTDANGAPITGVAVRYTSSDPSMVPIGSFTGEIKSKRRGRATFTAEATIFGTKWTDSVDFDFDWPVHAWVIAMDQAAPGEAPRVAFDPVTQRISRGGAVMFINMTESPAGIVFDDPTHVEERTTLGCVLLPDQGGSGNIAPFGGGPPNILLNCRSRRFPVPGVYPFQITPTGARGVIIVEDREP